MMGEESAVLFADIGTERHDKLKQLTLGKNITISQLMKDIIDECLSKETVGA